MNETAVSNVIARRLACGVPTRQSLSNSLTYESETVGAIHESPALILILLSLEGIEGRMKT